MNPLSKRAIALAVASALTVAACGSDDPDIASTGDPGPEQTDNSTPTDESTDVDEVATPTTEDGASTLRANLTSLLQEHLYLAAITLETALDAGGDLEDPAVVAASGALDENSVALSEVITSVAGADNGEAFLGLWREHIGFFVDYTLGKATGDQAMADQAVTDLDGYKLAAGDFFDEITGGELPADVFVASLDGHTSTLFATIDALVAGDPSVFAKLRTAAQHMPGAALAMSTAVVAATS